MLCFLYFKLASPDKLSARWPPRCLERAPSIMPQRPSNVASILPTLCLTNIDNLAKIDTFRNATEAPTTSWRRTRRPSRPIRRGPSDARTQRRTAQIQWILLQPMFFPCAVPMGHASRDLLHRLGHGGRIVPARKNASTTR